MTVRRFAMIDDGFGFSLVSSVVTSSALTERRRHRLEL